ncbi:MAG TPA: D-inositol-3-phosphate glycosyltransferase [Mycobacteriales bacterium]
MLSMHTSPLDQPGSGDAGGLNVYVLELAKRLARAGTEVDVFTRATSSEVPPVVRVERGLTVRSITAGPYEGLSKADLPAQMCAFSAGVLRAEAQHEPGHYDLVHSHYWLSGQAGWLVSERLGVPLVHTAHTLGRVKNLALADGDHAEPLARLVGEEQVVAVADRLLASTAAEARELVDLYDADPGDIVVVPPGVDLEVFRPGSASGVRTQLGVPPDGVLVAFVGRIQPLKAPDLLIRAVAAAVARDARLRSRLVLAVVGGASGEALGGPAGLARLAADHGVADLVRFVPPLCARDLAEVYRAADVVAVPSHNESFGLVALEAQACGTPVLGAAVGGLRTAVVDGATGRLVAGHDPEVWAAEIARLALDTDLAAMGARGVEHAAGFGWDRTATLIADVYADAVDEATLTLRALEA